MLYDFIFLLILFALIYSYTSSQNQFAATASAIRQIWSGSCRLSCRHSGHSGISGLSGLPGPHSLGLMPTKSSLLLGQGQVEARGNISGPSHDCNCESCPCALIENFLRTCRPATNIYAELIQCTSNCVTYFLQMLEDAYEYVMRVFECNATCQRQAQLISTRTYQDSDENFSFGRGDKENPIDKVKSAIRPKSDSTENVQQHSGKLEGDAAPLKNGTLKPTNKEKDDENKNNSSDNAKKLTDILQHPSKNFNNITENVAPGQTQEGTSKDIPVLKEIVNEITKNLKVPDTSNIPESSNESVAEKGFCSKCIAKGRTCLKECPRAKSKTNKK